MKINANQAETLLLFTQQISVLTPKAAEDFIGILQPITTKRKELLTVAGEPEKYLYFVLDGVQRVYYLDDLNREATLVFTYAPSFGGVLDALLLQQPSLYFYETLTPSTLLRAPVIQLLQLMETHRDIEVMVRKGVTAATSGVLGRLVELQCYNAEDRYKSL